MREWAESIKKNAYFSIVCEALKEVQQLGAEG